MKYTTGSKNILADAIYGLHLNGKPKPTHESNSTIEFFYNGMMYRNYQMSFSH